MIKDKFTRAVTGIEFRDDSLVITCLKPTLSKIRMSAFATIPLNKDEAVTVSEIKNFLSQHKIKTQKVFVSIPKKWAIIKFMDIPSPSKDRLKEIIHYEIGKHIPFQVEDILYDFHAFGKNGSSFKVVIACVPKEKVEYILDFLKKIPLHARSINISSFCLLNAIETSGNKTSRFQEILGLTKRSEVFGTQDEVCISLYLKKGLSDMAVIKGGSCVYLKDIDINIDDEDLFFQKLDSELNSILPLISADRIDRLILSGPESTNHETARSAANRLNAEVTEINPISKFYNKANDPDVQELAFSLGACLPHFRLGSMNMNLLPSMLRHTDRYKGPLIAKMLLSAIAVLGFGLLASGLFKEKMLLMAIEENLKKNNPELSTVEKISSELNEIEKQMKFLSNFEDENTGILDILAELTRVMPLDVWLTNLDFKEYEKKPEKYYGEVIISGFSSSASKLISIIEASPLFENTEFIGSITKTTGKEGFRIKASVVRRTSENTDKEISAKNDKAV
ncbi:MAG: PilN domain-containing protein [Nitrospirota bacterium]